MNYRLIIWRPIAFNDLTSAASKHSDTGGLSLWSVNKRIEEEEEYKMWNYRLSYQLKNIHMVHPYFRATKPAEHMKKTLLQNNIWTQTADEVMTSFKVTLFYTFKKEHFIFHKAPEPQNLQDISLSFWLQSSKTDWRRDARLQTGRWFRLNSLV